MSDQQNNDPFYKLFKDTFSYNPRKPSTEKKPNMGDLYSHFKQKTNIFHQRITPNDVQKQEILNINLQNNINHVYNTEVLPQQNYKVTILERQPTLVLSEDDHVSPKSNDSGNVVPEAQRSPLKAPENHLKVYEYKAKPKEHQLTLKELLARTSKIKKKSENLVEVNHNEWLEEKNGEQQGAQYKIHELKPPEQNKRRTSPSPEPKPKKLTDEETRERLRQELQAKAAEERKQKQRQAEEIKRKAVILMFE